MTQQDGRTTEQAEKASRTSKQFADEGKERIDDFAAAQNDLIDCLQNVGRRWTERLRMEASLGADMASQLTASRSFADTTNAVQHWASKHLELAADDTRRMLSDSQQIMDAGTRFWANAGRSLRPFESRSLMS